jgi:thiamine-phosphate pyrophosphorylase
MNSLSERDLRLIVITDRNLAVPRDLQDLVRLCLEGGAPAVQLRDKDATARELYEQAVGLRALTKEYNALLFINDRLDVALAAGADGVHLGPTDLPLEAARKIVPRSFLIGISTDDPEIARRAEAKGADYIGCGAVFGTSTKAEVKGERIGPEGLALVAEAVSIPVVGIGGITLENAAELRSTGAAGIAVVGALMQAPDPRRTTEALLKKL